MASQRGFDHKAGVDIEPNAMPAGRHKIHFGQHALIQISGRVTYSLSDDFSKQLKRVNDEP